MFAVTPAFADPIPLLIDAGIYKLAQGSAPSGEVIRSRFVLLDDAALPTATAKAGHSIRLNLFDDVNLDAELETVTIRSANRYTWSGWLVNDTDSSVTIAVVDGVVQANVHSSLFGEFQLRYVSEGLYEAREIDPSQFPLCGVGAEHAKQPAPRTGKLRRAKPDPKTATYVVDVLCVYMPLARAAVGGDGGVGRSLDYHQQRRVLLQHNRPRVAAGGHVRGEL